MAIEQKPSRNEAEYFARLGIWLNKRELQMIEEFDRRGAGFMSSLFRPRK